MTTYTVNIGDMQNPLDGVMSEALYNHPTNSALFRNRGLLYARDEQTGCLYTFRPLPWRICSYEIRQTFSGV